MILYLGAGGNNNFFFLKNLMEDWISLATLAKQLLKISDGLVIVSLITVIAVGKYG